MKQSPVQAMVIKVDGSIEMKTIAADLKSLQDEMGGYIELIKLNDGKLSLYINEEGKLEGLPVNLVASLIANQTGLKGDFIVGNAVFLGKGTADGRETSVDPDFVERISAWAKKHKERFENAIKLITSKEGV